LLYLESWKLGLLGRFFFSTGWVMQRAFPDSGLL
jgi:hypothetical protein